MQFALLRLELQSSFCHGQSTLIALISTNKPTHMDKNTTRNTCHPREFFIPNTSPLIRERLSALKPIGSYCHRLHSPSFAPVILDIELQQVYSELSKKMSKQDDKCKKELVTIISCPSCDMQKGKCLGYCNFYNKVIYKLM